MTPSWSARIELAVRDILPPQQGRVHTIAPEASVQAAIRVMASERISALPVMENGRLVGIVSERDYVRKVASQRIPAWSVQVHEIMTRDVITVTRDVSIKRCMQLMVAHRIRHLPVMAGNALVGLISITDLVRVLDARLPDPPPRA